ncbi:hypothetical protein HKD37_07G020509 [Glycine soja]
METKSHSGSGISPSASPEFEFWMVRNPSFPQPNILSADQLIVNGVLLPLHLLNKPDPSPAITDSSSSSSSAATASKRWKDIFKKSDKKNTDAKKLKEKKSGVTTSAELNINIWPFSRSKSAGNAATRPKPFVPATRKANSAPCSRSNSAGESKSRKWPSSPARPGVHLGRSSPVWQVRRPKNPVPEPLNPDINKSKRESHRSKVVGGSGSSKTKVLNLNVPMCIGYRHHFTCRSDENNAIRVSNPNPPHAHANVGGKLFTLRSLFTKKNVVTSH